MNQGLSYFFSLIIEGSGSGSVPRTNGSRSGSRRTKNIPILRIRIQVRIRNTAYKYSLIDSFSEESSSTNLNLIQMSTLMAVNQLKVANLKIK
jgi:hypothetical protein